MALVCPECGRRVRSTPMSNTTMGAQGYVLMDGTHCNTAIGTLAIATYRLNPARVDAAARCIAKMTDRFISAAEWTGDLGRSYRAIATSMIVLDIMPQTVRSTLARWDMGIRSGGIAP